jgi:hypothetical protein
MIDLFNAIENRLKPLVDSREIREIRLWNNQNQASAERMTKGVVHGAIYVEFIADRVNNIGLGVKDVFYTVRFHFAIKNLKSDKVENLNFHTEFAKLIQGFSSNGVTTPVFSSFRENARENDEDHDALAFPFVDYSTIYKDYTAYFFRNAPSMPEGTLFNPQFGILERGETPEIIVPIVYDPVTALVLDGNATQAGTVGQPITPITVSSILGDVKQLAIDGNDAAVFDASGLSLAAGALTNGAVAISGTLLAPAIFTVVAIGLDGLTVAVAEVDLTGGALVALTASISLGDAQTVWKEGQFTPVVFTINAGDDDFTVSGVPAGATFDKPSRTLSGVTYASLSSGVNTITITFTGIGGYTGAPDVDVTVTREAVADIDDVVGAIHDWWRMNDATDNGANISEVAGLVAASRKLIQTTDHDRPFLLNKAGVKWAHSGYDGFFNVSGITDVAPPFNLFAVIDVDPIAQSNYLMSQASTERIYFNVAPSAWNIIIQWGGVSKVIPVLNANWRSVLEKSAFILHLFIGGDGTGRILINGGEDFDSGVLSGFPSSNLLLASNGWVIMNYKPVTTIPLRGSMSELGFINGILTTDERQDIEGILANTYSLQNNLAAGHPHKTTPPLL